MKGRLIAGILVIALGLAGCGAPGTAAEATTPAATTAVTTLTTVPVTTTTTKIIETTISNTETKTGNDLESEIRSILDINENIEIIDIEYCDIDFNGIEEMIVLTGGWPQNQIYSFSMSGGELELLGSEIQPFMCEYIRDLTNTNYRYFDVSKLNFFSVSYNDKDYIAYKYGSKSSYFATNSIDIIGIDVNGEFFDETILISGRSKSMSAEPTYEYYYQKKDGDKYADITKDEFDEIYTSLLLGEDTDESSFDYLYPVFEDGSYDYIDKTGKVIIDGNFDTAEFFSEGLGVVSKDGKYGAVNINGDITVPLKYREMNLFSCGLSLVKNDEGLYGYVDYHGNIKIPFSYSYARDFSENIAIVADDEYGYFTQFINRNGETIWEGDLGGIPYWGDFHDGYMRKGNAIYDINGKMLITNLPRFTMVEIRSPSDFNEGYATIPSYHKYFTDFEEEAMNFFSGENWYYTYIDTSGVDAFGKTFDIAGDFSEGLAVAGKDGKTGVIDTTGEFVFYFEGLYPWYEYSDGLLKFSQYDDIKKYYIYGFIDRNGEIALPAVYDIIHNGFIDGIALIEIDGKLAYINKQGEIIYELDKPDEVS
jgi:hypothetical protein